MHNLNQVNHLRRASDPIPELAGFDPESGLAGRDLFLFRVDQQWDRCSRSKQPLGTLLLALDGVERGDSRLDGNDCLHDDVRAAGQVVSRWCRRRADFAGRMRRQEIGVMLAESQLEGIRSVAEHIIQGIQELQLPHPTRSGRLLTVSVGGAVTIPSVNRLASSLLVQADRALSDARELGGNQAVFYGDDVPITH